MVRAPDCGSGGCGFKSRHPPQHAELFLRATPVIDWTHAAVLQRAHELGAGRSAPTEIVRRCFEWVRDTIPHTGDHALDPVTCSASEVLEHGTGFCYAKSHLLAALLRANRLAAGFVYQRLTVDEAGSVFCLHGLNAVWLPDVGWYRLDARGDRADLRSSFAPPTECLPFHPALHGEALFTAIRPDPLEVVVRALRTHRTRAALESNLPDATEVGEASSGC